MVSCNGVGRGGVGGSLIVDPEGVVLQESGEGPYMQTALIDFERVRYIREKGTSGVTTPLKDFRKNKQKFSLKKKNIIGNIPNYGREKIHTFTNFLMNL